MPKILIQMYEPFMAFQIKQKNQKYHGDHDRDPGLDKEIIMSLGKLPFKQLEKDHLIFYEEDLRECGIDVTEASVYAGVCTHIFREECGLHQRKASYRGSVKDFVNFNAKQDAELLHKAMKGIGTYEDTILMLLASRSNNQRQEIKVEYKKAHGKDLVSDLKSELGGLFETLVVALMTPPISYDASQLHKALKGVGTDDDVLIEILASRTCAQIKDIVKVYKKECGGKLEKDITGDTSGNFQKLLIMLLQRSNDEGVDDNRIEKDAKELIAAGKGKVGTDEDKFINILGNRSHEHLRLVFDAYKKVSGNDIEDSIEGATNGNLENLMLAVVKCAKSVPAYFAESLYRSMRRAGTDDQTLMRIMVSRGETDMLDIRACFKKMYGASLYTTIQEDTTGDYGKALLYLCGGND
ncbi:annexin A5-like [Salvelinus namaycush]|uniref:Annexin n=1 Tax=Salvelinus namaycush TaxID=8040 RepID=A0A8U0UD91_SALNM|nr:annexin A5-like [Salvelinus namaycush]